MRSRGSEPEGTGTSERARACRRLLRAGEVAGLLALALAAAGCP